MKSVFCVVVLALSLGACSDSSRLLTSQPSLVTDSGSDARLTPLKKPSGPTVTITTPLLFDLGNDGVINWDDTITVTVETTAFWSQVNVTCAQSGVDVFGSARAKDNLYPIRLRSASWSGGAAECHADVLAYGELVGTLAFHVEG